MNVPKSFHGCHLQFTALDKLVAIGIKADSSAYTHTNYIDNYVISVMDKHGLPTMQCLRPEEVNASYRAVVLGPSLSQVQQPGIRVAMDVMALLQVW
jgi:hypothetical protein